MATTTMSLEAYAAALEAASAVVATALPSENGLSPGAVAVGNGEGRLTPPGREGRAVITEISGAVSGRLVVAFAKEMAEVLEEGPRGPLDLAAALTPTLGAAVEALGGSIGGDVSIGVVVAHDAEIALMGNGDDWLSVPLLDADTPAGLVALFVTAGSLGNTSTTASDDVAPAPAPAEPEATPVNFAPLEGGEHSGVYRPIELLHDVELGVTAELGRTRMTLRHLLSLAPGSVVELDRVAGSQIDLLVNGTLIARGEVVVIDDEFGVRISEVVRRDGTSDGRAV